MSPTTWEAHHSPRASPSGCGELLRSLVTPQWPQSRYQFLYPIDSHPFRSMSIWHPIPEIQHFLKIWPWKSRVKVMGVVTIQSHNVGLTSNRLTSLLFHVNPPSHSWVMTFFKIWPWNSKVKVMGEVTVQSHNVGQTSYQLTSLLFHVNRPSHSWNTAFSKFDLENQGSRSNGPNVAQLQV